MKAYRKANKALWEKRSHIHFKSEFYDIAGWQEGRTSLKEVEINALGDISGKRVLHLQCHFGQDSISMARMGAEVIGIDFSHSAIKKANELAKDEAADATFICCDIFELPENLDDSFDIVFTSFGTICWFPDLLPWARLIHQYLKTSGQFIFVEFHPYIWSLDEQFREISYSYFNTGVIEETEIGTYADNKADISLKSYTWNHSLGEVFNALSQSGMRVNNFQEYDYSPHNIFENNLEENGRYYLKHYPKLIPLMYEMRAVKND